MKLLIVEDESSLRELLARALRKEQYVVETAKYIRRGFGQIGSLFV